jgi:hypothetical protein
MFFASSLGGEWWEVVSHGFALGDVTEAREE